MTQTLTVDQIIDTRLRAWFPTIDIGTAVDISRVRKDLEALAAGVKAELLTEGQVTREKLIAEIEGIPRYEPSLKTLVDAEGGHEAIMLPIPAGQPASFVAIQDLRRVVGA